MKILLINPPSPFLLDERVFPPLGLLYVAASLEKAGYKVHLFDLAGVGRWIDSVRDAVSREDFDAYGLTSTTPQFPRALSILQEIKSIRPDSHVIIGGPHSTVQPESCLMFDKVVIGDGETGILKAINGDDSRIIPTELVKNLDGIPFPARHLIDMKSYRYELAGLMATSVITQRGCPFGCAICCGRNLPVYRRPRYRSVENVTAELKHLMDTYSYQAFMFYDDEFNLNRSRTLKLCKALKALDIRFRCFLRADLFTDEIAEAMANAGCYEVCVGVESGSQRVLDIIHKGTKVEQNSQARWLAKKYGLRFKAFTIVGLPGEDYKSAMETKKWLLENRPDEFDVTVFQPYPGSAIYFHPNEYPIHFDVSSLDFAREKTFFKGVPGEYRSFVRTASLTAEEIVRLRDDIEKEVREALGLPQIQSKESKCGSVASRASQAC